MMVTVILTRRKRNIRDVNKAKSEIPLRVGIRENRNKEQVLEKPYKCSRITAAIGTDYCQTSHSST